MVQEALRLKPESSAVLVVDVQERLLPAMPGARLEDVKRSARVLVGAARELSVPVFYTEQYPKGLGATEAELLSALVGCAARRFEKLEFSACAGELPSALRAGGRSSVVVLGMETHVCVFQSVRDLVAGGFAVHVASDGVVSRRDDHRQVGLELCARAGAVITTSETVVFDWMVRAGTDSFKKISALVR